MIALIAQVEAVSGNAGWVGAGLLGLVLAWLMFVHLPAKDKQIKDLLEIHAAERAEVRLAMRQALEKICKYRDGG